MTTPSPTSSSPSATDSSTPTFTLGAETLLAIIGATMQLFFRSQVGVRKDEVAWTMNSVARAVRQAEKDMVQHEQTPLARYADLTATQLEAASRYLHEHDFQQIMADIERISKEHPAVLMGTLTAFGILIGRFLKNTSLHKTSTH